MKKYIFVILWMIGWLGIAVGQLAVPSIIGDHMVVKQSSDFRIWGWNTPNAGLVVTNSWGKDTVKVRANQVGDWEAVLKTPPAGGPYEIKIRSGKEELVFRDVLSGEVWLCSGQSNMEWNGMRGLKQIKEELPHCENNQIRFFYVDKRVSATPQDNLQGKWMVCDAESLNRFSAIGYFFGKTLQHDFRFPVGLINSNWGGTPVEFWMPGDSWENPRLDSLKMRTGSWAARNSQAYNAMIYPLRKYNITGTIWYQGESNVSNADGYSELFTAMIEGWRKAFRQDFPFYYVQLAPYARCPQRWGTTLIREQQDRTLAVPKTGMVVITDLVDDVNNIHPQLKKEVGQRLARLAAAEVYGEEGNPYSPRYQSMTVKKNKVEVVFSGAVDPLVVEGQECVGFEIAGEDRKFYPAKAKVEHNNVVLSAKEVKNPVAVRFGFYNEAIGNLFGDNGLPVAPFRTDTWTLDK